MKLYHATYKANLESILELGLGAIQRKNWDISTDGVVCFSTDMDAAISYCETAEDVSDEVYDSGIVCLEIDSEKLNDSLLFLDSNILYEDEEEAECYCYRGIIAPEYCKVCCDENIEEDFEVDNMSNEVLREVREEFAVGDEITVFAPKEVSVNDMGFFDEIEYDCYELFKKYCGLFGFEVNDEDGADIDFYIAKCIQEKILELFENAGIKINYYKETSLDEKLSAAQERSAAIGNNEYFKESDEWFTYYVNVKTGEKKFQLEEGDIEVDAPARDDFYREEVKE